MIGVVKSAFIFVILLSFGTVMNGKQARSVENDFALSCMGVFLAKGEKIAESNGKTVLQKKQMLIGLGVEYFLFDWSAKMALGRPFQSLTDAEKKTYINEYSKYISYTWFPDLLYDKKSGVKVNIRPISRTINEKDSIVDVDIVSPDGKKYELSLRVRKNDKKDLPCHILNITFEGVDIVMSYRSQFASYIEANNNQANSIIGYLKEKNDKLKKTSGLTVPFK